MPAAAVASVTRIVRAGVFARTIERTVNETVGKRELAAGNVNATAAKWFAELVPVETRPVLSVSSDPPGAAVAVDGTASGRTPVTLRDLTPGSHSIAISMSGRVTQTRTVELVALAGKRTVYGFRGKVMGKLK